MMKKRALPIVVISGISTIIIAISVSACGDEVSTFDDGSGLPPADAVPSEKETRVPPPSRGTLPPTPAKPPPPAAAEQKELFPPAECWPSNLDVGPGLCFSSHQLITSALHACFEKGGEPIDYAADDATACAGGGFRRANVKCCTASPNAKAPPDSLPEPAGPLNGKSCSGGSNSGQPKEDCGARAVSSDIIETASNFAKKNLEVRSFHASARCKDGTWSAMSLKTCT
jgi:hypothetical protein